MRGLIFVLLIAMTLTGCSQSQQVENQAYALVFGADLDEQGNLLVSVLIPKIGGTSGESGSSQGEQSKSEYMFTSAKGKGFSEAMELLRVAIPRKLNLTQIEMIVVSEKLASDFQFNDFVHSLVETYQLFSASYFVVCIGNARDFVEAQKPVIGTRISKGLLSMFENYIDRGYVPDSLFADYVYATMSAYSDPLAILAGENQTKDVMSSELPGALFPDELPIDAENKNEYVGAAVMRDGLMVGRLDGAQMLLANVLMGNSKSLNYVSGDLALQLTLLKPPHVEILIDGLDVRINIKFRLSIAALTVIPESELVSNMLRAEMEAVIKACQSVGVEPFGFAEIAAKQFPDMNAWREFNWRERFKDAEISLEYDISRVDT